MRSRQVAAADRAGEGGGDGLCVVHGGRQAGEAWVGVVADAYDKGMEFGSHRNLLQRYLCPLSVVLEHGRQPGPVRNESILGWLVGTRQVS